MAHLITLLTLSAGQNLLDLGELSNTTKQRHLSTSKVDVLTVISSPEKSRASRCWAAKNRTSGTTQMAPLPNIEVVYGANIISFAQQKSVSIIEAQLESLELVGLFQPEHAHVHVVLSYIFSSGTQAGTCHNPPCSDAERTFACSDATRNVSTRRGQADASKAMALIGEQVRRRNGTLYSRMGENLHEWPALYRLWRLACESPSHLFLYFHNKGVTRDLFGVTRRALSEMVLFKEVVSSWRAVRSLFALHHPVVQHAGMAPAEGGWEWFNFFWAIGSHLRKNVQPIISWHRHYYELWLQREASVSQCSNDMVHSADATSAFRSMCELSAQEAAAKEVVGMSRERGCESSLNLVDCSIGRRCGSSAWAWHILLSLEHGQRRDILRVLHGGAHGAARPATATVT